MVEPLVTAIISAYRAKDYLKHRIENIRASSIPVKISVLETVVQTDLDVSLVDYYEFVPDLITIYAAWNRLIKTASTPYVVVANCDDLVHPRAYERQLAVLEAGAEISYFNYYLTDGYKKSWSNIIHSADVYMVPPDGYSVGKGLGPFPMWRKDLHDEVGYFDEQLRVFGDSWFWTLLERRGTRWGYINGYLGAYARTGHNLEGRESHLDEARLVELRKSLHL